MLQTFMSIGFSGFILFTLLSVFFYISGRFFFTPHAEKIHSRIEKMNIIEEGTEDEKKLEKPLSNRLGGMFQGFIRSYLQKYINRSNLLPLQEQLKRANMPDDPMHFWTQKITYAMLLTGLGFFMPQPMFIMIFGLVGFFLPNLQLRSNLSKRRLEIQTELPSFLDILSVTVKSANSLEEALDKVTSRMEGTVSNEFKRVLDEVNAGRRRRDAFNDMSHRMGVDEIESLVSQINQADDFGTGVERALALQANHMRKLKRLVAETKAKKTAVLLILPSMFLLFTCLILIVGPSIVGLIEASAMI